VPVVFSPSFTADPTPGISGQVAVKGGVGGRYGTRVPLAACASFLCLLKKHIRSFGDGAHQLRQSQSKRSLPSSEEVRRVLYGTRKMSMFYSLETRLEAEFVTASLTFSASTTAPCVISESSGARKGQGPLGHQLVQETRGPSQDLQTWGCLTRRSSSTPRSRRHSWGLVCCSTTTATRAGAAGSTGCWRTPSEEERSQPRFSKPAPLGDPGDVQGTRLAGRGLASGRLRGYDRSTEHAQKCRRNVRVRGRDREAEVGERAH
jgi:hypothetical protein